MTVEVSLKDGNGTASRSLTATNESYELESSGNLYWTYTAVKKDSYFTTGQTDSETPLYTDDDGNAQLGLPDGTFGKFSVGTWLFQFYAYEVTVTDSSDDAVVTVTTDEGTKYYAKGDLFYSGESYNGEDCYTTLSSGGYNTVSVNVQLVEATGDTGTVTFSGIYFVSVDDEGNETVETLGVSSLEDAGVTLRVLIDDGEVTTDTSVLDTSKVLASSSETSGSSVTVSVSTGYHTVQVILYSSDGTVLAESSVTVFVTPNRDTAVTGSLEVVTTEAELDDDIDVSYASVTVSSVTQLASALADSEISTVTLTNDISSTGTFVVTGDTTIDLCEYTLTADAYYAFSVSEGASLTISNGTVEGATFSTFILSGEGSSLTVESGTYSGAYYCVYDNTTDAQVTINGGTFSVTGTYNDDAVFTTSDGSSLTLTINGGTFNGGTQGIGVMVDAGSSADITITGGEFTSSNMAIYVNGLNSSSNDITVDISGGTFSGLVYIAGYTTTTISGGTFTRSDGQALHIKSGNVTISGGTFTGSTDSPGYSYANLGEGSVWLAGDIVIELAKDYPSLSKVVANTNNGLTLNSNGIHYYKDPQYSGDDPDISVEDGISYTAHTTFTYMRTLTYNSSTYYVYFEDVDSASSTTTVTIGSTEYTLGDYESIS